MFSARTEFPATGGGSGELPVVQGRRTGVVDRVGYHGTAAGRRRVIAADQPEAGGTGVDVVAGHAQGMVVVPEGRRGLVVAVQEIGIPQVSGVGAGRIVEQGPDLAYPAGMFFAAGSHQASG